MPRMVSPLPEPERNDFFSHLTRAASDVLSNLKRTITSPFGQESPTAGMVSPLPEPTMASPLPQSTPTPTSIPTSTPVPTPTLRPDIPKHGFESLIKKYFPQTEFNNAQNVAMGESSFNPGVIHPNSNGSKDYGLFQINDIHAPVIKKVFGYSMDDLLDPEKNIKVASWLFRQQGWRPWVAAQSLGLAQGG